MNTIALRFSDNFAPEIGTITAHEEVISSIGYVWYGKMGSPISKKTAELIMENETPKVLLIHSGKQDRYWAYIEKIQWDIPVLEEIPSYYRANAESFKTWFKVRRFCLADRKVMSQCTVASSGVSLSEASKKSMSPFFVIIYNGA